ncbi:ATP-binding cassette domain-containing protein [Ruminococcus sp.]|uniref:ATP-binding cassette domain-containing protein n=1 Tax=Ruminococcus sp. TaxID=41978 RepID=UPI003457C9CF
MGRSGSGKSTISKLIQRLYIPEAGKISVDGMDISLVNPAMLIRQRHNKVHKRGGRRLCNNGTGSHRA